MLIEDNKLPHWIVGDQIHFNKYMAMKDGYERGLDVRFNLFEEFFDTYDWSEDSPLSFGELIKQRCLQLRESYDYLRLYYSGGHDSHTILLGFLNNNIFLDEIVVEVYGTWYSLKDWKWDKDHLQNVETTHAAFPFLDQIKKQIPKTKITMVKIANDALREHVKRDYNFFETFGTCSAEPTSNTIEYQYLLYGEPKIKGSYCNIRGSEKPRLLKHDGKFYMYLIDNQICAAQAPGKNVEMFYITTDFPELHLKQCHMLKNWIKLTYPDAPTIGFLFDTHDLRLRQAINDACRYPLWHPVSNLGLGKYNREKGFISQKLDANLQSSLVLDPDQTYYNAFIKTLERIDSRFFNDQDYRKDLKGIVSKKYYLGE